MQLRALGIVVVSVLVLSAQRPASLEEWKDYLPEENTSPETTSFASSRVCKACHPSEYESWYGSYHRTMTQWASSEAIVPEWEGVDFGYQGRSYRLFKRGEEHFVDMPRHGTSGGDPDERVELPVLMTTGSHQMQYYWLPVPWAEPEMDPEGAAEFARACAGCHRDETLAGPLEGGFFGPEALRRVWDPTGHHESLAAIGDVQRQTIAAFVERIQFPGRLVQFPFVYFVRDQRWLHDSYTFLQPEEGYSSVEPYAKHWNGNCDDCHSTDPVYRAYRWDEEPALGQTRVAELGIACEACHGAGRAHVDRYKNPLSRYRAHLGASAPDDIVNPGKLAGPESASVCARCHAELVVDSDATLSDLHVPGERIEASAHVLQLEEPPFPDWLEEALHDEPDRFRNTFWADGTIRVAGRDYNGLVKSACFQSGELSCISCHTMHGADPSDQLRTEARGDGACLSCHVELADSIEAHTHHPAESVASRCYSCHMPHTTWGLLGAIRAHRIDIPSVNTSLETGRPDACSLCHLDKSLGEVAQSLTQWYGQPELDIEQRHRDVAASLHWLLSGDAVQRATIAWHMGYAPSKRASGNDWQPAFLAEVLDDPYPAVRYAAHEALGSYPGFKDVRYQFDWPSFARRRASRDVHARVRLRGGPERPRLLFRGGKLDAATILKLKALRDDSRIVVAE